MSKRVSGEAKRSDLVSLVVVTSHLALIYAPVYLGAALGPTPWWVLLWLWFGMLHPGCLNLMHECAHLHVFKSRKGSEALANWVLGPMMFVGFGRYREVHFAHHNHLGKQGDPKYSYKIDIAGRKFATFIVSSVCLVEAFRKLSYVHSSGAPEKKVNHGRAWLVRTAIVQSLFLGSLVAVAIATRGHASLLHGAIDAILAYGFIYFYGLLSLTILFANLRAIAEHQPSGAEAEVVGAAALRNVDHGTLSWLVFGSYGFSDHATHHWHPAIPYYSLRERTLEIAAHNPAATPTRGYVRLLGDAILSDKPSRSDYSRDPAE